MADNAEKPKEAKKLAGAEQPAAGAQNGAPSAGGAAPAASSANAAAPAQAAPVNKHAGNPNYDDDGVLSLKLPVILVTPNNDTVGKLGGRLKEDEEIRVSDASATAAPAMARQMRPCILIASINQNTDVVKLLTMLKPLKDDLKKNYVKFIVLSKINNPAIIATFEKAGCHEYIIEPINERSLQFKINLQTKAVKGQRKKLRADELRRIQEEKDDKKLAASGDKKQPVDGLDPNDPANKNLSLEEGKESKDDVWVFRGNKPKKAGGKWTMRMKGPDPNSGDWVEVDKNPDGSPNWRFMEKGEDPKNAKKKKGWQFTGEKPTFTNGEWNFQGEKPELALVDEKGEKQASKVKSDGKDGLVMSKDSDTGLKLAEEREKKEALDKEAKKKAFFSGDNKGGDNKGGGRGIGQGQGGEKTDAEKGALNDKTGAAKEDEKKKKGGLNFADFAMQDDGEKPKINDKTGNPEAKKEIDKAKAEDKKEKPQAPWLKPKDEKGKEAEKAEKAEKAKEKELKVAQDANGAGGIGQGQGKGPGAGPQGRGIGQGDKSTSDAKDAKNAKKKSFDASDLSADAKKKGGPDLFDSEEEDTPAATKKTGMGVPAQGAKPGEDGKKPGQPGDLAGMAMNFDEEPEAYANKVGPDGKPVIGGKNNAKTEKINNSKWGGHDLTPEEMLKQEERLKRQAALKHNLHEKMKKAAEPGSLDLSESEETEEGVGGEKTAKRPGETEEKAGALGHGGKNFLKKSKDGKPAFNDKSGGEDEAEGGWSKHREEEEKKKKKMGFSDADLGEKPVDERDQLVEIDAPKGVLTSNKLGEKIYEYPPDAFGSVNGTWEGAGNDNADEQKRKCFVFVEADIRMKKIEDVRTVKVWWIFHGDRPLFNVHKKVWFCKKNEPVKIEGFSNLPQVVQNFLLSVSPHEVMKKKREADEKIKKAREDKEQQIKKAREEFKEQQAAEKEKRKEAEEQHKASLEEVKKKKEEEQKASEKQSLGRKEEEEKKGKQRLDSDAEDAASGSGKKDKKGDEAETQDAKDASAKDSKDKKKKNKLEADLGLGDDDQAKKNGKEAGEGEGGDGKADKAGDRKKKGKLEADLEFGENAKAEDKKGKQRLEKEKEEKGNKLAYENEKKKEDEAGGSQKLEKKKDEKDFKGEKATKEKETFDGKDSKKHSHKHNKFEAELKVENEKSAESKESALKEEMDDFKKLRLDSKKSDKPLTAELDVGKGESGAKTTRPVGLGEDESGASKLDKVAAQDKDVGFGEDEKEGEEQHLSPLDEALKEKAVVPLPSAPMMAVFVAELLIANRGDAAKALDKFARFLSQGCSGVSVTVFYVQAGSDAGDPILRVAAATHPNYPIGSDLSLSDRPHYQKAFKERLVNYPDPDGPVYVPINVSKAADANPVGLLVIEPLATGVRFTKLVGYFQGVAQCLRGAVIRMAAAPAQQPAPPKASDAEAA